MPSHLTVTLHGWALCGAAVLFAFGALAALGAVIRLTERCARWLAARYVLPVPHRRPQPEGKVLHITDPDSGRTYGYLREALYRDVLADLERCAGVMAGRTVPPCVLCETAPCSCPDFGTPAYYAALNAHRGRRP